MTTETTPTNTPAPAVATPAAVVQSAPANAATETAAQPIVVSNDPLGNENLQARIDAFLASKKAAPADAAATAATTPAAADTTATPAAADTSAVAAPAVDAANAANGEAPAATETTATPQADGEPAAELVVELPPRNAGGNPLKIAAPDAATADALRRLNNGYLRGEEARTVRAEADAALARVREFEIMLQADPLGLIERIPQQQRVDVARTMLAENFDALRDTIESWWNDDSQRRLARAEGLETRDKARSTFQSQSAVVQQVRAVSDAVRGLIPEQADPSDAQEFFQDAVRYLASIADSRDSGIVTPQEVSQLLDKRLSRYGFKATAAAATATTTNTPAPAAAPAPAAQSAAAPAAAVPNVARVHAINQQRAAAAATTTVGAGATPVTAMPKPPKGLTIEQAADWAIAQRKAAQ